MAASSYKYFQVFLFAFVLLSPQLCSALYSYKIILTGTRQRAKVGFALAVFMLVI